MSKHTPTAVHIPELMVEELEDGNCATLVDGLTNWIATIHHLHEYTAEQVANEIRKRCNAHDALVAALEEAGNYVENVAVDYGWQLTIKKVKAALKLARGE